MRSECNQRLACPGLDPGADWLLDLGPDGGVRGGEVVAEGTPEAVAAVPASYTGQYLQPMLERAEKAREAAD
ncbi:excinuclease ABC subunit A [Aurantiacibacter aquimixticola]|uniref:UvrABC system protein A n=1 Tax=Aurantiacibacter aquimixticola TaxID=1958945 RepID=A0A419RWP6_9SPHN|nr:excinuclease ABC subunit A [Aurantiacibacter aquimixticola]